MLEMNLKIIGNDIKAEINEGWGNIRLRMDAKNKCRVIVFSVGNTRHLFLASYGAECSRHSFPS